MLRNSKVMLNNFNKVKDFINVSQIKNSNEIDT